MDIQKSLVYFREATSANLDALKELAQNKLFQENHALKNHLRDVLIETEQAMTTSRIQLKLVEQMNQTFSAIVSNNLNNIMKNFNFFNDYINYTNNHRKYLWDEHQATHC